MPERRSQTRAGGQRAEFHTGFIRQIPSTGRLIAVVVWLLFLAYWPLNGFAINYGFDAAAASHAIDSRLQKFVSSHSPRVVHSSPRSTALSEAIHQNTPGNSQGLPLGLSWDKDTSSTKTLMPAPSGWSALTGWAQVYQEDGAPVSPNSASGTVQVQDFRTSVHLTDGTWVKVQDQAQVGISAAHYVADFSGDAHIPIGKQTLPDGSVSLDAPPSGYNDHFWPTVRGTYTPGTVDGVFVEAQMKTIDPDAHLVAQLGADWWQNATAQYAGLNVNNTAVGLNNWIKLTTQWQTLYYSSLSPQQLQADPPPGLLSNPCPRR
ncbi:hypothetical protein [Bradyrhizobium neotropicale]|uniref:hypothetical protein n=1 Tax=Bradyrhizobium neotropicale TaxID=1497615 RepID=UPI001AD79AE4|nr:hypothetical protein [Bradyrhizobium neotropicale]MBO4227689.1 hypothetical protein [Bradyrhizobium neotropicale]